MPEPTLLGDVIQLHWQDLTPNQRVCWHCWAATHPQRDEAGNLRVLYGQQAHYARNADIAIVQTVPLLADPPPNDDPPADISMKVQAWPKQSIITGGVYRKHGHAWLETTGAIPANTAITVRQGYDRKKTGRGRPPRIRHVTVIESGDTGIVSLIDPTGYYATTAGENRYSRIQGLTAQRRPELPLGTMRIINTSNGMTTRQTLPNPNGGARRKTNRPRATGYKPNPGDHYP